MDNSVRFLICFLLTATKGLAFEIRNEVDQIYDVSSLEENIKEFIRSENKDTRENAKSDIHTFFGDFELNLRTILANLSKAIEKIDQKIEDLSKNQEKINASLSSLRNIQETSRESILLELRNQTENYNLIHQVLLKFSDNQQNINASLSEILNTQETSRDSILSELRKQTENSNLIHQALLKSSDDQQKINASLADIYTFQQTCNEVSDSILLELRNHTGDSNKIHQTLLKVSDNQKIINSSLSSIYKKQESSNKATQQLIKETTKFSNLQKHLYDQQKSPHSSNIERLDEKSGLIFFDEKTIMSYSNRKFWIFENTTSVKFFIEHIRLGSNAHLTFTGISATGEKKEIFITSTTKNATEFTVAGCVIVVTLIMKDAHPQARPSFGIKFNSSDREQDWRKYATKVITTDGLQSVSFPENNQRDYPVNTSYVWLIAPFGEKPFELTLNLIDTENCTGNAVRDYLKVFSVQHGLTRSTFELQGRPERDHMFCGRRKDMKKPEFIGYSTASILFFFSDQNIGWRGFNVQVKTFDLPQGLPIFS